MQYRELGRTGIFVSRICLGTMTFGGPDTPLARALGRLPQEETTRLVKQALDAGVNFVDTADVYGGGDTERQVGIALKGRRSEAVLATKCSARIGPGPNQAGQSRTHMMQALESSLKRLQTDHIDLYQIHNFDPRTPFEILLRTLDDMISAGKVRYIGCSNLAAWQLAKANGVAERMRFEPFVSIQSYYSLVGRDVEREIIPAARDLGASLLCWSPLAGGFLAGKVSEDGLPEKTSRRAHSSFPPLGPASDEILETLRRVSSRLGLSPSCVALAWLLSRKDVTSIIIGAKTPQQLADNLKALDVSLSDDDLRELEAVTKPRLAYPGWVQTYNARGRVPIGHPFDGKSWVSGEEPV